MPAAHLALQPRCQAASTAHLSNGKTTPGQAPVVLPRPAHSNNNGRTQLQEAPGQAEAPRPAPGTPGLVSEAHRRSFGPLKVCVLLSSAGHVFLHPSHKSMCAGAAQDPDGRRCDRCSLTWTLADSGAHAQLLAGPTNVHPRILAAQAQPMLGYFQPAFLDIMDEIQEGLRCAALVSARARHAHLTRLLKP